MKPCDPVKCDPEYIAKQTWLTVHQVGHYWQLPNDKAAYHFLKTNRIAKAGRHGGYRVAKKDLDDLHPEAQRRPRAVKRSA